MKTTLKILTLIALGALLVGCGSSKTVNFAADTSVGPSNEGAAKCNLITSPTLNGRIKVYTNPYGDEAVDTVEVYFESSLINSLSNGNVLKAYKWYVKPDGTTFISPTPNNIIIKDLQTQQIITGGWPSVSQKSVNEYTQFYGLPSTTLAQFLQGKSLVISGIEMEYQVLRFSVQNGTTQLESVDTLIPAFVANPIKYASNHVPMLQMLHPNYSVMNQPWNDLQFQQRTMSYCF